MTASPTIDEVLQVAEDAKDVLDIYIANWSIEYGLDRGPDVVPSTGFCRGAAIGLHKILQTALPHGNWKLDGGWGVEAAARGQSRIAPCDEEHLIPGTWPAGMTNQEGVFQGHFWVRGSIDGEDTIIDLTADQFGHEPWVVTAGNDPRYKSAIAPDRIDTHFTSLERGWGTNLFCRWLDFVDERTPAFKG